MDDHWCSAVPTACHSPEFAATTPEEIIVTSEVRRIAEEHRDLVLSNEAFDRFVTELDARDEPVPALVDLFAKHRKVTEA